MFNSVAPYRYLFPTVYLFVADIANPQILYLSRHPCKKNGKSVHQCEQQSVITAVTVPSLVGCVDWSQPHIKCITSMPCPVSDHDSVNAVFCLPSSSRKKSYWSSMGLEDAVYIHLVHQFWECW